MYTGSINHKELDSELHLIATAGEVIFIPCIASFATLSVTIWSINGSLYPLTDLPTYHISQHSGIIVNNITNSIYKCYSVVDNRLQELFTITLYRNEPLSGDTWYNNTLKQQMKLVSNGLEFNSYNFSFQFRINNINQENNYCNPGNVTFTMNITDGVQSLWSNNTNDYLPTFSPSKVYFEGNSYAEVYGTTSTRQECAQLDYNFKVDIDGIKSICIPIFIYFL